MSFSANYPTTAPSLLLDFSNSNTVDPRVTFTRASTATYFNSIGSLTTAAINSPRLDYDPTTLASQGLLIEEQRTNSIRNNTGVGAVAGAPGNLPTNWSVSGLGTLTQQIVGTGTSNGITYIDFRFSGTTSTTQVSIRFEPNGAGPIPAVNGQTWTGSVWTAVIAGSTTNITSREYSCNLWDASNVFVGGVIGFTLNASSTLTRSSGSGTIAVASTAAIQPQVYLTFSSGVAIDITLRIGLPQLEQGAFATSVIPNAPTFTSRASTGTFFDSTGTLQTAAINVARNNYNPASLSTPPLLLIEEARTNSIRNNTMVGAVAGTPGTNPTNWAVTAAQNGVTKTILGVGTENGINYVDIQYTTSGGNTSGAGTLLVMGDLTTQIAAASGQTWTGSCYLKLQAGSTANLTSVVTNVAERTAAGSLIVATTLSISPTSAALATQRNVLTRTLTDAATERVSAAIFSASYASGVAIDITLRIGLPQLELGAYPTSVIPTTTVAVTRSADLFTQAAVTRSADVASVNTLTPWFNAVEGSMYVEVGSAPVNNIAQIAYELNDNLGGGLGRIFTRRTSGGTIATAVITGGVSQSDISSASAVVASATYKVASAFKTNDYALSLNGATAVTNASGTMPSTITKMFLGQNYGFGQQLNGYIRRLTYYPIRLSNANLQALTS